jgi:site-specific DNA-methyltransferase (adenine-specific)
MTVAIEDAGFEIRDQIMWIYGSGFPKSHNVGKQENCEEWNGWGTALKPAHEPICVARKPLIGTVAENVLTHGTGAINVDGCRVAHASEADRASATPQGRVTVNNVGNMPDVENSGRKELERPDTTLGRWPANIIHDGSAEVLAGFPDDEKQSPARFFYCAKASKKDRDEGLEGFEERFSPTMGNGIGAKEHDPETATPKRNYHPTVKPTNLMQYLCRLVTPPNGLILDPFLGSGSTGKAAIYEGFRFIGFDLNQEYIDIAKARIEYAIKMNNESSGKKENTLFEDEE